MDKPSNEERMTMIASSFEILYLTERRRREEFQLGSINGVPDVC